MANTAPPILLVIAVISMIGCEQSDSQQPAPPTAATVSAPQEFDDKPLPQVLDTQAINKNMLTVSQLAQGYVMPDSSTINDYQEAYFTVIKQPSIDTAAVSEPTALNQFDYIPISPDMIFVKAMLSHFDETIALASIEQRYGKNPELLGLARDIISSRQNESQILQNWLAMQLIQNTADPNQPMADSVAAQQEIDSIIDDMQQEMVDTVMTKNADQAFAQTVLIHHKGAIAFSQVVAKYGNDDKVRSLTNTLIDTQQAEIQLLQNWLRSLLSSYLYRVFRGTNSIKL